MLAGAARLPGPIAGARPGIPRHGEGASHPSMFATALQRRGRLRSPSAPTSSASRTASALSINEGSAAPCDGGNRPQVRPADGRGYDGSCPLGCQTGAEGDEVVTIAMSSPASASRVRSAKAAWDGSAPVFMGRAPSAPQCVGDRRRLSAPTASQDGCRADALRALWRLAPAGVARL